MRKPSKDLRNLYTTYLNKRLRADNALEFASGFILDLINAFGEKLEGTSPVMSGYRQFTPVNFLLQLNDLLAKYKQTGTKGLEDIEKALLVDTHLMLGTLISSSLKISGMPADSNHERYQIPEAIAADLEWLIEHAS